MAEIVESCSDSLGDPKPPWRERKRAYLEHLEEASESALKVSLADKLHNARTIVVDYRDVGEALWERFNADRDQVLCVLPRARRDLLAAHPGRARDRARGHRR